MNNLLSTFVSYGLPEQKLRKQQTSYESDYDYSNESEEDLGPKRQRTAPANQSPPQKQQPAEESNYTYSHDGEESEPESRSSSSSDGYYEYSPNNIDALSN